MPLHPSFDDIALRLILTVVAAGVIGLDRGLRGHAAGLRTIILVCLAASGAMILSNLLLSTSGKAPALFATMDVLRLPLGILTGVGFIGAGTILRRGDLVTGVTTAATLWVVTVIGLSFGGGELVLGIAITLISVFALTGLKWFDARIPRKQRAILVVQSGPTKETIQNLGDLIAPLGYAARFYRASRKDDKTQLYYQITWKQPEGAGPPLDLLECVAETYTIVSLELAAELPP